jgi:hypothetical protein
VAAIEGFDDVSVASTRIKAPYGSCRKPTRIGSV